MGRLWLALTLAAVLLTAMAPKQPDVEILESKARREEGKVTLDGRVRNTGSKAIRGLVVIFQFTAPDKAVITNQKTEIEEPVLEPGQEGTFRAVLIDPVRAVYYRIDAEDRSGKELRVARPGPYSIE
jgi:hypothetical protein